MNRDYGVVYLSSVDWAFRKQDHQFIATELAGRGRPVLFVENTGARLPAFRDLDRVASRLRNWSRRGAGVSSPTPARSDSPTEGFTLSPSRNRPPPRCTTARPSASPSIEATNPSFGAGTSIITAAEGRRTASDQVRPPSNERKFSSTARTTS